MCLKKVRRYCQNKSFKGETDNAMAENKRRQQITNRQSSPQDTTLKTKH